MFEGLESPAWKAAGWTMIHFLWIGTLVGLGCWLGRLALRRAPPPVRYGFAVASLVVLVGIAGALFALQWRRATQPVGGPVSVSQASLPLAGPAVAFIGEARRSVSQLPPPSSGPASKPSSRLEAGTYHWHTFFDAVAGQVPWIWLTGTPITLLVIGLGLAGTSRLQRRSSLFTESWTP